jgi:hypothetical protein
VWIFGFCHADDAHPVLMGRAHHAGFGQVDRAGHATVHRNGERVSAADLWRRPYAIAARQVRQPRARGDHSHVSSHYWPAAREDPNTTAISPDVHDILGQEGSASCRHRSGKRVRESCGIDVALSFDAHTHSEGL